MTKKDAQQKDFLLAYKAKAYNITAACEVAGIERSLYYSWIKSKKFAKKVDQVRESLTDFVESKLVQAINEGSLTGIIFYLKCKGQARGWVDMPEKMLSDVDLKIQVKINGKD